MTARNPRTSDEIEVRGGRRPPARTEVYDWVPLSGVSPHAITLYTLLRMHVNRSRDDDLVWTGKLTLAVMMGLSRGDKIDPYITELINIGAVEKNWAGMPRHNVYTVHSLPPDGYAGALSLKRWYSEHRPLLELKRQQAKTARDARRAKKKQTDTVTPKTGQQLVTPKTGQQVTPGRGQHVALSEGEHVAPETGREPRRGFDPAVNEPSLPPASPSPQIPKQQEKEVPSPHQNPHDVLSEQERALHATCLERRPRWSASVLATVLTDPLIRERPWPLVQRAMLIGARTAKTYTPRRLLADGCPHWSQAEEELTEEQAALDRAASSGTVTDEGPPAANLLPEQRGIHSPDRAVAAPDSPARQAARTAAARAREHRLAATSR